MAMTPALVLASSSPYRHELLERLGVPFESYKPEVDETPANGEAPNDYVRRLALEKAQAIARIVPRALIIGSDQVAVCDGAFLPKSGRPDVALAQLAAISGRQVEFITGLCLLNSVAGTHQLDTITFTVNFRPFSADEARRYMEKERPFNCAASFKSEGLGITLVESLRGDDPTALIGLPLVRLAQMLRNEGVALP